jgi:murein DD-endopeptidase MepM/ murein hydrolase activator NlpD
MSKKIGVSLVVAVAASLFITTVVMSQIVPKQTYAVALDGHAYNVLLSRNGKPVLQTVDTSLPVLHYAGKSVDGYYIAYVALDAPEVTAPLGRHIVTATEVTATQGIQLVPSGDLFIENPATKEIRQIDLAAHYTITAVWSPVDKDRIAYTFSSGSEFGVAVVNVANKSVQILRSSGVLPDYLAWNVSGNAVQVYVESGTVRVDGHGYGKPVFTSEQISIGSKAVRSAVQSEWSPQLPLALSPETYEQPFELHLPRGQKVRGKDLTGVSELSLADATGNIIQQVKADALVALFPSGVLYKRYTSEGVELNFLTTTGNVTTVATASTIYKLPFSGLYSPDLTVTQGGQNYPIASSRCKISSHATASGGGYAYDMQASYGNESILAAATGTVVYIRENVTCNSYDSNGCADYSSSCSGVTGNYGWGNTVMLQHADGSWTKYSHLAYKSAVPPTTGRTAYLGCHIATEGHTGATSGNKNGCGDHLHFQRQSSSALSGPSIPVTFSDTANPLSCRSYESGNGAMSCIF